MTLIVLDPFRIPAAGGPVYDADVQAWMDARAALSDPVPTAYANAVNQYVLDLKAISGMWATITQLLVFAGATTVAGGLVPIKGLTPTHSNLVAGDFDLKTGVKGNTTNKHIATGYNQASFGQSDMHTYALVTEAPTNGAAGGLLYGNGQTGSGAWGIVINTSSGNSASRCRHSSADAVAGVGVGGYGINRSNGADYQRMIANSVATIARVPQATNSSPYYLLASGGNGNTAPVNWSNGRILVWAIGTATTLANYTAPGTALTSALNAI